MASDRPRLYWDSCCFISYLNGDRTRSELRTLMADAQASGVLIVTSAIFGRGSGVRCAGGAGPPALDPDVERRIEDMWRWRQAIRLVEVQAGLAARARALLRHALTNGWRTEPSRCDSSRLGPASVGIDGSHVRRAMGPLRAGHRQKHRAPRSAVCVAGRAMTSNGQRFVGRSSSPVGPERNPHPTDPKPPIVQPYTDGTPATRLSA